MYDLDKNESYDLKDLNSKEKDILFEWLEKNDKGWKRKFLDNFTIGEGLCWCTSEWMFDGQEPTKNALKLFRNKNKID